MYEMRIFVYRKLKWIRFLREEKEFQFTLNSKIFPTSSFVNIEIQVWARIGSRSLSFLSYYSLQLTQLLVDMGHVSSASSQSRFQLEFRTWNVCEHKFRFPTTSRRSFWEENERKSSWLFVIHLCKKWKKNEWKIFAYHVNSKQNI